MDKFRAWISNFMQGRYGVDELGHSLCTGVIVLLIASIVFNLIGHIGGSFFYVFASILNGVATVGIIYTFFRILSRDFSKRSAENDRFLKKKRRTQNQKEFKYLKCPHCQQEMRVPRGKGKIAVKCPKCGESTITKS